MRPDLFGLSRQAGPRRVGELKGWVAAVFRLGADVSVLVTEPRRTEPGCPPQTSHRRPEISRGGRASTRSPSC